MPSDVELAAQVSFLDGVGRINSLLIRVAFTFPHEFGVSSPDCVSACEAVIEDLNNTMDSLGHCGHLYDQELSKGTNEWSNSIRRLILESAECVNVAWSSCTPAGPYYSGCRADLGAMANRWDRVTTDCAVANSSFLAAEHRAAVAGGVRGDIMRDANHPLLGGEDEPAGPALTSNQSRVLQTMALFDASRLVSTDAIVAEMDLSERLSARTIGPTVRKLIRLGLAERPEGRQGGAKLTMAGRRLASKIAN